MAVLCGVVSVSVAASLLPVVAAHAAVVSMDRGSGGLARSVPVSSAKTRPAPSRSQTAVGVTKIDHTAFPAGGVADVAASGRAMSVGGLPVTVSPVSVSAAALKALGIGAAAGVGPASVRVAVLDRSVAQAAGVSGVVLSVSRSDGVASSGRVRLRLDYSGFTNAFGADFGARLHVVALPGCALSTPSTPACQVQTDLAAVNASGALTAELSVPGAVAGSGPGLVIAATSSNSSSSGTFAATSLSPAYSWAAGNQGGSFSYSYPLRVPASVGGPSPSLALSYDSGSVDAQTLAQNGQNSWAGEGWDLQTGYIERSYRSCSQDGGTTEDLCWFSS